MKAKIVFALLLVFFTVEFFAQVGIGNTNPNATLDISASDATNPSNEDGLLIPRIDEFPAIDPGAPQDGMMVFVTGNGSASEGFYYWDNATTSWVSFAGGVNTQNTLDEAYDQGGAGAGRTITADNGAVVIEGNGGLRVASTNETHMLFVDGVDDAVGIGESNPQSPLHIGVSTSFDLVGANSGQDGIFIKGGGDNSGLNAIGGSLSFGGATNPRENQRKSAIALVQTTLDEDQTGLAFYVHPTIANSAPMVEGMRLNHQGFLGINNNDPDATLDLVGTMQFVDGNEATGYVLSSDANGNASWADPTTLLSGGSNTLDGAYDQGGAGAGSIITADNGAVTIEGTDGFIVTGVQGTGSTVSVSGTGTRMFFNPNKAAFRAGNVSTTQWDDANIGNFSAAFGISTIASGGGGAFATGSSTTASGNSSFAIGNSTVASGINAIAFGNLSEASGLNSTATGYNTTASGDYATAMGYESTASETYATALGNGTIASGRISNAFGYNATASGNYSTAIGYEIEAFAAFETTLGRYNTIYTPGSTTGWVGTDRLFTIGNGSSSIRSNALTIYKDGTFNINDAYNMPIADGTLGQVMTTDGAGNVTFQTVAGDGTGTDDQNLLTPTLVGTTLNLNIENGSGASINLAPLQDGTGTDDQTIDTFSFNTSTNILSLEIENDGIGAQTVDLSSLAGGTDATTASNGLTETGDDVRLGGSLTQNTTINQGNFDMHFQLGSGSTADFQVIRGGGSNLITAGNDGYILLGDTATLPNPRLQVTGGATFGDYMADFYNPVLNTNAAAVSIRIGTSVPHSGNYLGFFKNNSTLTGHVNGNGSGGVNYSTVSDRRLKTNILDIDNSLELIAKMQPRIYEYKSYLGKREYGFIAQELQEVYPQAVSGNPNGDVNTDPMMVDYGRLTPILTAGIKELQKEVLQLKKENETLKQQLKKQGQLEARMAILEALVLKNASNTEASAAKK